MKFLTGKLFELFRFSAKLLSILLAGSIDRHFEFPSNQSMFGRPFENQQKLWVIAPSDFASLSGADLNQTQNTVKLLTEHRRGIEEDLGCKMEFTDNSKAIGPRWLIGPAKCNPALASLGHPLPSGPEIYLDRKLNLLITNGRTPEEVTETFSYLRSLGSFERGLWKIQECENLDAAVALINQEVKITFPSFTNKNLNWEKICQKHMPEVKLASDPIAAMQKWVAELQDAHTWIKPFGAYGSFPYDLKVENDKAYFYRLAKNSLAWEKGVRPGFEFVTSNLQEWTARTSASPHSKPFVIGARLLATPMDMTRNFTAHSADGIKIEWQEKPTQDRWNPLVTWRRLTSGNAYLRIQAWILGKDLEEKIDQAFEELKDCPRLIVDLRANPGGNLLMAHRFRNRFLPTEGIIGWVQSTGHSGILCEKEPLIGTPAPAHQRWSKDVIFLTDPLTYSASEDALLGLQGLPSVKVIGQASGGGSGRPRVLQLMAGYRLTVSTSLTFDLKGHCIEGNGIPLDRIYPMSFDEEDLIHSANSM